MIKNNSFLTEIIIYNWHMEKILVVSGNQPLQCPLIIGLKSFSILFQFRTVNSIKTFEISTPRRTVQNTAESKLE